MAKVRIQVTFEERFQILRHHVFNKIKCRGLCLSNRQTVFTDILEIYRVFGYQRIQFEIENFF